MSHVIRWVRHPHPQSQRLYSKSNRNIYVLQIGASFCYKLGQLCFITNQGPCCYKLGQLHYYKLGQVLLQIAAAITNQGNHFYKVGQLLQLGAECISNCGRYCKLGQLLQIGAQQALAQLLSIDIRSNFPINCSFKT